MKSNKLKKFIKEKPEIAMIRVPKEVHHLAKEQARKMNVSLMEYVEATIKLAAEN